LFSCSIWKEGSRLSAIIYFRLIFFSAKDDLIKILKSVGIEPAAESIDRILTAMKGKKLHEVYNQNY